MPKCLICKKEISDTSLTRTQCENPRSTGGAIRVETGRGSRVVCRECEDNGYCAICGEIKPLCGHYLCAHCGGTKQLAQDSVCEDCEKRRKKCSSCGKDFIARNDSTIMCEDCSVAPPCVRDRVSSHYTASEYRKYLPLSVELEAFKLEAFASAPKIVFPRELLPLVNTGTDGSIKGGIMQREWRLGPFLGPEGDKKLRKSVAIIRDNGFRCNKSCGLHVHIDMLKFEDHIEKIMKTWELWEPYFFSLTNPARYYHDAVVGGQNYCAPVSQNKDRQSRYRALNLTAYKKYGTLEFRLWGGTTLPYRVMALARLCRNFIYVSAKKKEIRNFSEFLTGPNELKYWTKVQGRMQQIREVLGIKEKSPDLSLPLK